jgi:hypothetical protein
MEEPMPSLNYRLEVKVSRNTRARLEQLRAEFKEQTGKPVSMSTLVSNILDSYLEKLPAKEVEEEKKF